MQRRARSIPPRNLVALAAAALAGFFLGLDEALRMMPRGRTLTLAAIGLGIAVVVAALGAIRGRGPVRERLLVSLLRIGLSAGVFAFVYEGMRLFLKIGQVGGALLSWVWAAVLALLLARLLPAGTTRPGPPGASS